MVNKIQKGGKGGCSVNPKTNRCVAGKKNSKLCELNPTNNRCRKAPKKNSKIR